MVLLRTANLRHSVKRRRLTFLGTFLAAAIALSLPSGASAQQLFGFNEAANQNSLSQSTHYRAAELEAAAGSDVHRLVVLWRDVEPYLENGTPVQNWSYYDRVVRTVVQSGQRPILVIMSAPPWAQRVSECEGGHCPPAGDHIGDWARFSYDVAKRYPQAAAIEVWNEPNGRGQWTTNTGSDPERYARLFSHAAGAIHHARPTMPVLIGSLFNVAQDGNRMFTIPTFLERFYRAGGGWQLRAQDGIGLHAYPWTDEFDTLHTLFAATMRQVRTQLARFDPLRKIWITETGVTTTGSWAVNSKVQAKAILSLARKVPLMADVRALVIHSTIQGPYSRSHPHDSGYGLLRRSDLGLTFAYCALAERAGAARSVTGCPPGVLEYLGETEASSSGGGSSTAFDRAPANLKKKARRHCRRKLRRQAWWRDAIALERKIKMRACMTRYVRRRL